MDETQCTFVSSRGILKSCTMHSQKPTSSCPVDIEHLQKLVNVANQRPNMTIYVCSDVLRYFVVIVMKHIKVPFYLISGDSDMAVPNQALPKEMQAALLDNPLLIRWASQNILSKSHPKMLEIPIGLDYHTLAANSRYGGWSTSDEDNSCAGQEATLQSIRAAAAPLTERLRQVYTNAHHRPDRYGDRAAACLQIPADLLVKEPTIIPRTDVWRNYAKYAFVASPYGNGIDCHRTWEALCCGAIPIIRGKALQDLFEGLPILRVAAWSDVTPELLEKTIDEFSKCSFNYEKLTLKYWMDRIKAPANQ